MTIKAVKIKVFHLIKIILKSLICKKEKKNYRNVGHNNNDSFIAI
jgi:hypothetical protein